MSDIEIGFSGDETDTRAANPVDRWVLKKSQSRLAQAAEAHESTPDREVNEVTDMEDELDQSKLRFQEYVAGDTRWNQIKDYELTFGMYWIGKRVGDVIYDKNWRNFVRRYMRGITSLDKDKCADLDYALDLWKGSLRVL